MTSPYDDDLWWEQEPPPEEEPTPHLQLVREPDRNAPRGTGATPFQAGAGYARRFPIDALPAPMAQYVRDLARRKQVPVDLPALTMLGMLGAVAGPRLLVRRDIDWYQPTNLYTCCALPSGAGKSPTVEELRRGAWRAQRILNDLHERRLAGEIDQLAQESEALHARATSAATPMHERPGLKLKARAKDALIERMHTEPPPPPQVMFDGDTTVEALAATMARNGGWGAIVDDEGTFFRVLGGMYNGGKVGNLGLVLVGYDCRYYKPARVNRDVQPIERAALSLVIAPQPNIVADIMRDQMMDDSGVINRFIVCVPGDLIGQRQERPATYHRDTPATRHDASGQRWWADLLERVARLPVIAGEDRTVIDLTREAFKLHRDYELELERRIHPETGDLLKIQQWVTKHPARVLRIAALLHLADGRPPSEEIDAPTMEHAITIGDWAVEHILTAGAVSGLSSGAGRIKEYVDGTEHGFCPRTEISRKVFNNHADAKSIGGWIAELVETGEYQLRKVKTTGRPRELLGRCGFVVPEVAGAGA